MARKAIFFVCYVGLAHFEVSKAPPVFPNDPAIVFFSWLRFLTVDFIMTLLRFSPRRKSRAGFFHDDERHLRVPRPILILLFDNGSRWLCSKHRRFCSFQNNFKVLTQVKNCVSTVFFRFESKSICECFSYERKKIPSSLDSYPLAFGRYSIGWKKPILRNTLQKAVCVACSRDLSFWAPMTVLSFERIERRSCNFSVSFFIRGFRICVEVFRMF